MYIFITRENNNNINLTRSKCRSHKDIFVKKTDKDGETTGQKL